MLQDSLVKHNNPHQYAALVLNADYRPLSYFPLSLWCWQDTVKAVFLDRVDIIESYNHNIHSPSLSMRLPSVVCLKQYVKPTLYPAFTRFNLFLRDSFMCQYCGAKHDLTFDHVIPRSKGGQTSWQNVVAACSNCNLRKGCHLPEAINMRPMQMPFVPTTYDLQKTGKLFPPNHLHESWVDYVYWDAILEP